MEICDLKPCRTVGTIKKAIEEAILDGIIPNHYTPALEYLHQIKGEILNSPQGIKDSELQNHILITILLGATPVLYSFL